MSHEINQWHRSQFGVWWNGQMDRVTRVIESDDPGPSVRVATKQRTALLATLAKVEARYKRGEPVRTEW